MFEAFSPKEKNQGASGRRSKTDKRKQKVSFLSWPWAKRERRGTSGGACHEPKKGSTCLRSKNRLPPQPLRADGVPCTWVGLGRRSAAVGGPGSRVPSVFACRLRRVRTHPTLASGGVLSLPFSYTSFHLMMDHTGRVRAIRADPMLIRADPKLRTYHVTTRSARSCTVPGGQVTFHTSLD